jgi:AcrR family transcriptional regulator
MKIDLAPNNFTTKDAFVRAALSRARDLAVQSWDIEHSDRHLVLEKEVAALSKNELSRRLLKLLSRPNRARAQISDAMRAKAKAMRRKGAPVREIAAELSVSIPSVYNITKD